MSCPPPPNRAGFDKVQRIARGTVTRSANRFNDIAKNAVTYESLVQHLQNSYVEPGLS